MSSLKMYISILLLTDSYLQPLKYRGPFLLDLSTCLRNVDLLDSCATMHWNMCN